MPQSGSTNLRGRACFCAPSQPSEAVCAAVSGSRYRLFPRVSSTTDVGRRSALPGGLGPLRPRGLLDAAAGFFFFFSVCFTGAEGTVFCWPHARHHVFNRLTFAEKRLLKHFMPALFSCFGLGDNLPPGCAGVLPALGGGPLSTLCAPHGRSREALLECLDVGATILPSGSIRATVTVSTSRRPAYTQRRPSSGKVLGGGGRGEGGGGWVARTARRRCRSA